MLYKVYGSILDSDITIAELPLAKGQRPDYTFKMELVSSDKHNLSDFKWDYHWPLPTGEIWLSVARQSHNYVLRFPDMADFLVAIEGTEVICRPVSQASLETIQHLFLDQVLPLVLSLRGKMLLHASAVATPSGIVAFAGKTGMGKSTLAASFSAHGYPLITDDCLRIEFNGNQIFGTPGYPGLRLWDDVIENLFDHEPLLSEVAHYSDKKRLSIDDIHLSYCNNSLPVKRIFFLTPLETEFDENIVKIIQLAPREAFIALMSYLFKLDITDRKMLIRDFNRLQKIVALRQCYSLSFPQEFALLPRVHRAILDHIDEN